MFKKNNDVILKTLLISILMICLSSFFSILDTFLKYISSGKLGNIKWYHHVSIGGSFGITMILFLSFSFFFLWRNKKNIILDIDIHYLLLY